MNAGEETRVELVITAPEQLGAELAYRTRCRTTLGALTQLVARARRHAVIAAPFLQVGHGLGDGPLADAVHAALRRGVAVDIASTGEGLRTLDPGRLTAGTRGRLRLFRPAANVAYPGRLGSHAKFCVVDEIEAYIGSANLTGPGLAGQLEMGVLVVGPISQQVASFWAYMVDTGIFVEGNQST